MFTNQYRYCYGLSRMLSMVLLMTVSSGIQTAHASHATGAQLSYRCTAGNTYELTYKFYRDCAGIPAPATISIDYTSGCFASGILYLNPTPGSPRLLPLTCPSATSTCNGGIYTGIEEWIYTGTVALPGPCADWTFSHDECCRNVAITTVPNADAYNMYVYAFLNNLNGDCNSSPVFNQAPVTQVCANQYICLQQFISEPDGDSLVFELTNPLSQPGTNIVYMSGYSGTQPFQSASPVTIDPVNGEICFDATAQEVTVYAILVSEYRMGQLIGQVEEDIQLTILNCNNVIPAATGLNFLSSYSATVAPGNTQCFSIASSDPDAADQTVLSWDGGISGAYFVSHGSSRDTADFCWMPQWADTAGNPHRFIVTVSDNHCPYIGTRSYNYYLNVSGPVAVVPVSGQDNELRVSPNPSGGNITFTFGPQGTTCRITVYDISGQRMFEQIGSLSGESIRLDGLAPGFYFLRASDRFNNTGMQQILIAR